jgi:hypothetical protein
MEIVLKHIKVGDLCKGYTDTAENGVFAYDGKLNVRPPFQREFVYNDAKRLAVIDTVIAGYPLNVMYWSVCENGTYEIIDGQQRTVSICQYVAGNFAHNMRYFHNLTEDEKQKILDYELTIYFCTGTDSEKLKWFQTINIAGEELTNQELRNAVYSGPWTTDAKKYFSKSGCPAYAIGSDYMKGTPIRQDYLETAISWISKKNIEIYMGQHQNDPNALALWMYYQSVITWVKATFPNKTRFMKGIDWGPLFDQYKDVVYNTIELDREIKALLLDDDVTNKSGIYYYVLSRKEKYLSIRAFSEAQKIKAYTKQNGVCPLCGETFEIGYMEADHITPWSEGGKTNDENCQMLCRECNRRKSNR